MYFKCSTSCASSDQLVPLLAAEAGWILSSEELSLRSSFKVFSLTCPDKTQTVFICHLVQT
jgi:hypothetical protein